MVTWHVLKGILSACCRRMEANGRKISCSKYQWTTQRFSEWQIDIKGANSLKCLWKRILRFYWYQKWYLVRQRYLFRRRVAYTDEWRPCRTIPTLLGGELQLYSSRVHLNTVTACCSCNMQSRRCTWGFNSGTFQRWPGSRRRLYGRHRHIGCQQHDGWQDTFVRVRVAQHRKRSNVVVFFSRRRIFGESNYIQIPASSLMLQGIFRTILNKGVMAAVGLVLGKKASLRIESRRMM